jgi:hypothetical protein
MVYQLEGPIMVVGILKFHRGSNLNYFMVQFSFYKNWDKGEGVWLVLT